MRTPLGPRARIAAAALVLCALGDAAAARVPEQGVQTGTLRGVVFDEQRLPVPGVSVSATSPALLGARVTVTDGNGVYVLTVLPAGLYEVVYELPGFRAERRQVTVPLGQTAIQDVALRPSTLTEVVRISGVTPPALTTAIIGANFRQDEIDALATPRTIHGIAQLAPGLTEKTPNAGQLAINGAFAYDNVFMVNGVDINDNLFAIPQSLFIEDAIAETQILTSGISAEYGRFSGGVINAVTKAGGNRFAGSWRTNASNPSWTVETPFERNRQTDGVPRPIVYPDAMQYTHEATFSGPLRRDRLSFFTAGRYASTTSSVTLPVTGVPVSSQDRNRRLEAKLTSVLSAHTVEGGGLVNLRQRTNSSGLQSYVIDPRSEVDRVNPNSYVFGRYHGTTALFLLDAQYSHRRFAFEDEGGTSRAITDSPFLALGCTCLYNAPYFDATDPEERNNRQLTGAATAFWYGLGRHETKGGYEYFRSQRTGGNSQSSTSYVFGADFASAGGAPVRDDKGRLVPTFSPGASFVHYYAATRGAVMNVDTHSLFVQDRWVIGRRLTADLGVRGERVTAGSSGGVLSIDTAPRFVPRLALSYDAAGDGARVLAVTYGQYSGRYNEAQVGGNSPVGHPARVGYVYVGPRGEGVDFGPGFDLANYRLDSIVVPTQNVFVAPGLTSPLTHEITATYGVAFGRNRGFAEASIVQRRSGNFIETFRTPATGVTRVVFEGLDAGPVTNVLYRNSDALWRDYRALVFQSRYLPARAWSAHGHYTLQLRNHGNFEGEGTNMPAAASMFGDYPEAHTADRHWPAGRLQNYQRHRLRVWTTVNAVAGRFGDVTASALWRVESGGVFSLALRNQPYTTAQRSALDVAGYPDAPSSSGHQVFFAERGTGQFNGFAVLDASVTYSIRAFGSRSWVKAEFYNLLNNQKLIAWDTTVIADDTGGVDHLGLPVGYKRSASFGVATGNSVSNLDIAAIPAYPQWAGGANGGRTFRVAIGLRF